MKKAKKRLNEAEYAKLCLAEASNPIKCAICRYNTVNYVDGSNDAYMFLFESKCKSCAHRYYGYAGGKPWIINNFKPLYEWEEEDERQS